MKRFFFIAAVTIMGTFLSYGIALGIWEMANPGHASENFGVAMVGLLLGAPIGLVVGLLGGAYLAVRWSWLKPKP